MRFLLALARSLWHPFYRISRPIVRRFNQNKARQISESDLVTQQKNLFQNNGFDWVSAHRIVAELVGEHIDSKSHRSQHYELFIAISQSLEPIRILEIGTADASFTAFLAKAFPNSVIETIDLPFNDHRFWNATDADSNEVKLLTAEFQSESPELKLRNENLRSSPNIIFREMNSLALSRFEGSKYDIIWVDGDHTFPIVACDIANAIRLLESGGVIVCDDIYLSEGRKGRWGSQETLRVLEAFTEAKMISTSFVLKSVRPERNFSPRVMKHLAIIRATP